MLWHQGILTLAQHLLPRVNREAVRQSLLDIYILQAQLQASRGIENAAAGA
jgi:hypothetical protein